VLDPGPNISEKKKKKRMGRPGFLDRRPGGKETDLEKGRRKGGGKAGRSQKRGRGGESLPNLWSMAAREPGGKERNQKKGGRRGERESAQA